MLDMLDMLDLFELTFICFDLMGDGDDDDEGVEDCFESGLFSFLINKDEDEDEFPLMKVSVISPQ